jgi:hypothetical protein
MQSLKYRTFPLLIGAISLMAAQGGLFRIR